MSNNKLCKGKHFRVEDRLIIEYGLDQEIKGLKYSRGCRTKSFYTQILKNANLYLE